MVVVGIHKTTHGNRTFGMFEQNFAELQNLIFTLIAREFVELNARVPTILFYNHAIQHRCMRYRKRKKKVHFTPRKSLLMLSQFDYVARIIVNPYTNYTLSNCGGYFPSSTKKFI